MGRLVRHQTWIALVAGVLFFVNLGGQRLWDDDESKNACCAREMLDRGDWIVPSFNYQPRYDKPILLYWLMMGSYRLFGATEFAARLPSAVLALGTALLTYHLGRRLFRAEVGLWAGLILATSLIFCFDARFATPDSTLTFCTTLALLAFVVGAAPQRGSTGQAPQSWWSWASVYAAMGLAMLAKGPVGVLVPTAAIGLFNLVGRSGGRSPARHLEFFTLGAQIRHRSQVALRWLANCARNLPATAWGMRPVSMALVVSLVALPWYLWVGLRTGGRWPLEFLWSHNVDRFLHPKESHGGGFLIQLGMLVLGVFPWSLAVLAGIAEMVRRIHRRSPQSPACLLLLIWSAIWIGVFSICQTKLPNYLLPAYPVLAVIAGLWLADWLAAPLSVLAGRWAATSWVLLALVGIVLTGTVRVMAPRILPAATPFAWTGLILVAGAGIGWWLQRHRRETVAVGALVVTTMTFLTVLLVGAVAPISRLQNGPLVGDALRRIGIAESAPIARFDLHLDGLSFYVDREVGQLYNAAHIQNYFANLQNGVLVTNSRAWQLLRPLLPPDVVALDCQRHFGRDDDIVLVARSPADTARSGTPDFVTAARPEAGRENPNSIRRR